MAGSNRADVLVEDSHLRPVAAVRVSRLDQNEKRQLDGQVLDRVFMDKASGMDTTRPEHTKLLVRPRRPADRAHCSRGVC